MIVNPESVSSPLNYSNSSFTTNDDYLFEQMEKFQQQRTAERIRRFNSVIRIGWLSGVTGIFSYCMSVATHSFDVVGNMAYISWAFVSIFFAVCGVLLMSTVPVEDCDLDYIITRKPHLGYITSFFLTVFALLVANVPPYLGIILLFTTGGIVLYPNKFTFFVSNYFYWFMNTCWPACFRAANFSSNPDEGVIIGDFFQSLHNPSLRFMWYTIGSYILFAQVIFGFVILKAKYHYNGAPHEGTLLMYMCIYGWLAVISSTLILECIMITSTGGNGYGNILERASFYTGFALGIPIIALLILGRERVFNFMSRRFDNDNDRLEQDGAFIAGLLDTEFISIRQEWWIHRNVKDLNYSIEDFRHHWMPGVITSIGDSQYTVLRFDNVEELLDRGLKSENLLASAKENLRCIEWTFMKKDLLDGSIRNVTVDLTTLYAMSRPLRPGERIDFFMSHSWTDQGAAKYEKMSELAVIFFNQHGRYPTFWFDKVCIDQKNIKDGLKALPINIMACEKMLVLAGETYATRLWCVWELCTLFAFMESKNALKRVKLLSLTDDKGESVLRALMNFSISKAHCYDPNEEKRLLRVIGAVGVDRFETNIRNLATQLYTS